MMMGTAKYLSPEQVRGKRLDGRADLYALGLVLYECLAGRVPFLGQTDADTALARLQRDPTDLARSATDAAVGLAEADPSAARPATRRPLPPALRCNRLSARRGRDRAATHDPEVRRGRAAAPPTPRRRAAWRVRRSRRHPCASRTNGAA